MLNRHPFPVIKGSLKCWISSDTSSAIADSGYFFNKVSMWSARIFAAE